MQSLSPDGETDISQSKARDEFRNPLPGLCLRVTVRSMGVNTDVDPRIVTSIVGMVVLV